MTTKAIVQRAGPATLTETESQTLLVVDCTPEQEAHVTVTINGFRLGFGEGMPIVLHKGEGLVIRAVEE